jgi:hypothetical protein
MGVQPLADRLGISVSLIHTLADGGKATPKSVAKVVERLELLAAQRGGA